MAKPIIDQLVAYMQSARDRPLPGEVVQKAKNHLLDTLAAIASGSQLRHGALGIQFTRSQGGIQEASVLGSNLVTSATALEKRYGLLEAVGPLSEQILASLGKDLCVEWDVGRSLRIKPFASCTATHSGLEAMLRLVQREKIAPDDVEAMECDLRPYPLVRAQPSRGYEE